MTDAEPVAKTAGVDYWVHVSYDYLTGESQSWTWLNGVGWVNDITGAVDYPPPGPRPPDH